MRTEAADVARLIVDDPMRFVKLMWPEDKPDGWQVRALESVRKNARTCVISSKGVGKGCLQSWAIWWYLFTRPGSQIIVTSVSIDNLAMSLWKELAYWYGKSAILKAAFEMTATKITSRGQPETWWALARGCAKTADATAQASVLAGLHGKYVMFAADEAGTMSQAVLSAAESVLANVVKGSGGEGKILLTGNPEQPVGPMFDISTKHRHLWEVIRVTSDPDDPGRSSRISKEWCKEQIEIYGLDSPFVRVSVYGEFPKSGLNTLLTPDEIQAAVVRKVSENSYAFAQKRLGCDIARFGDDSTCLFPRQGMMAFNPVMMKGSDAMAVAGKVAQLKAKWGSELELVDAGGGYGGGVVDALRQGGHTPIEVYPSGKPDDQRYFNVRAECWFRMADWVKGNGSLPDDPQLMRELACPTYTFQSGKLRLEEKSRMKSRLGFSPDRADALSYTFRFVDQPSRAALPDFHHQGIAVGNGKCVSEFDPFRDTDDFDGPSVGGYRGAF